MSYLFTSDSIISFFILVLLEIVLGIDNVIFVSIIINRLPEEKHKKARLFWVIAGSIVRSLLLLALGWLLSQKGKAVFTLFDKGFDLASLVMLAGGLFLIYKSVHEIHQKLEGEDVNIQNGKKKSLSFPQAVIQIMLVDMVFSFDSIITAGGTAKYVAIMIAAVIIAMIIMFAFSPKIASFIHKHPTFKMLALSFLVMIGLSLVIEGWASEKAEDLNLKNYIYFGMAFSFIVELLNMQVRKKHVHKVIELNEPHYKDDDKNEGDMAK
ncbi:MAG: TerC family protein [Bacteroidota bacterium]|nr:TerC family protein [Bacteroidota bacterium]MDQ6890075.1 TerC family protein [Bacteroidota bacterium]